MYLLLKSILGRLQFMNECSLNFCDNRFEVTVLVLTFNPNKDAMFLTLDSIICQEDVELEIVIADDGSVDNLYNEIKHYFNEKGFCNWRMIRNEINKGTVINLYSGLMISEGYYIKTISPGDALCGVKVLREWIDFNYRNKIAWSFSDAYYYKMENNKKKLLKLDPHPNNIKPYLKRDDNQCRWNYVVLDDIALGATILCQWKLLVSYIERILYKVVFAEDNVFRLMMFDGIVGGYYPTETIWYEHGTGISTSKNQTWYNRLQNDWEVTDSIMLEKDSFDKYQQNMIRAFTYKNKRFLGKLFISDKFYNDLLRKFKRRKSKNIY